MNANVIITDVRHVRNFQGRDGASRYALEVDFKLPFSTNEGKLCYDNFVGTYITDATQQAYNDVAKLCGQEVQIVCYFNVNAFKRETEATVRHFQNCNIRHIYPRNYEN